MKGCMAHPFGLSIHENTEPKVERLRFCFPLNKLCHLTMRLSVRKREEVLLIDVLTSLEEGMSSAIRLVAGAIVLALLLVVLSAVLSIPH